MHNNCTSIFAPSTFIHKYCITALLHSYQPETYNRTHTVGPDSTWLHVLTSCCCCYFLKFCCNFHLCGGPQWFLQKNLGNKYLSATFFFHFSRKFGRPVNLFASVCQLWCSQIKSWLRESQKCSCALNSLGGAQPQRFFSRDGCGRRQRLPIWSS